MPRVLLLDDEPSVANAHALCLRQWGFESVEVCHDPNHALDRILAGERYGAVLCDGRMLPGLGGVDFYRRAVSVWPGLVKRIVFLSGGMSDDDRLFVQKAGLPSFLKPVDPTEWPVLAATLRRLGLGQD